MMYKFNNQLVFLVKNNSISVNDKTEVIVKFLSSRTFIFKSIKTGSLYIPDNLIEEKLAIFNSGLFEIYDIYVCDKSFIDVGDYYIQRNGGLGFPCLRKLIPKEVYEVLHISKKIGDIYCYTEMDGIMAESYKIVKSNRSGIGKKLKRNQIMMIMGSLIFQLAEEELLKDFEQKSSSDMPNIDYKWN